MPTITPFSHYQIMREKHGRPVLWLAAACFSVIALGSVFLAPTYHAPVSLTVKAHELKNEWDLLKAETQDTDFEEQILSRSVIETTLRDLKLPPFQADTASESFMPLWLEQIFEPKDSELAHLGEAIREFKKRVKAERIKHSLILMISVKAKTPQKAADYSNTLVKSYIKNMKTKEIAKIKQFIKTVNSQLVSTSKSLEIQAAARKSFLTKQGWNDYLTDLQHSKAQVAALKNSLRFLNSYEEIKTAAPNTVPGADELGVGMQLDSSLDALNRQLSRADNQLNNVSSRHSAESLGVLQARFEREWIDSIFKRQAGNVKERRERLEKQLLIEQKRLEALMLLEPKARTIEAEFIQLENAYQELLKRRTQAEFHLSVLEQSPEDEFERLEILDPAIPPLETNPWRYKILFFLSAIFAGFTAFLIGPVIFELLTFEAPEVVSAPQTPEPAQYPLNEKLQAEVSIAKPEDDFEFPKAPVLNITQAYLSHRKSIYGAPSVKGGFREDIE